MREKMLQTLEYDKMIKHLERHASTAVGKERVRSLTPANGLEEVNRRLAETDEAMKVNRLRSGVSFGGIRDIRSALKRAAISGTLAPQELLDTAQTLQAARILRRQIQEFHQEHSVPLLDRIVEPIVAQRQLEEAVNACIDENAEVRDQASSELNRIRQGIRTGEARVREKIEQMIRNPSTQKMLQEQIVTLRGGRYVIPVKQEYRAHFGGIIHDQSASGATLFIEPESVVEANNKLRELRLAESREVDKILQQLSQLVAAHEADIRLALERLALLDFAFAKANLAHTMKATLPIMNDRGYFKLKQARHPLIPIEEVRPIDVELGNGHSMMIITGPNTGGKTVSLKTVGLIHLLAMSGLFVPADEASQLCVFDAVYADIGDEQSIEQNLSTFSSHMTNIVRIIRELTPKSLVLLDELGAGTDPTEGSALAISILEHLRERGCRVIATTHYSELKAYAYEQKGILNASMEFDVHSLRPTYRLLIGIPGRSNAFAIAERLGLPTELIDTAKQHVTEDDRRVDNMIATLEQNRTKAETDRADAEQLRREAEQLKAKYEEQWRRFEQRRENMILKAERDAAAALQKAKAEAERIIADLRKLALEEQVSIKEHKLIETKKKLENAIPTFERQPPGVKPDQKQGDIKPGDEVMVTSLRQKGTVIEDAGADEWLVQLGIMKMKVGKADVTPLARKKSSSSAPAAASIRLKNKPPATVQTELDLRGSTLEEALHEVERFLDAALVANLNQVSIIHGKGTGVLRSGIQQYLRKHKYVKQFRSGGMNEGGNGVTVAEIG